MKNKREVCSSSKCMMPLLTWLKEVVATGVNIDGSVLCEKVDIALFLDIENLRPSGSWLHRFKARHRLSRKTVFGDAKNTGSTFLYVSEELALEVGN